MALHPDSRITSGKRRDPIQNGSAIFVAPTAAGTEDGSSWDNACTFQTALGTATAGQTILLKEGEYKPGVTAESTFVMIDGVSVYGGWAGDETKWRERHGTTTTISGQLDAGDPTADVANLITGGVNCELCDLTISYASDHMLNPGVTRLTRVIFDHAVSNAGLDGTAIRNVVSEGGVEETILTDVTVMNITGAAAAYYSGTQSLRMVRTEADACDNQVGNGGFLYADGVTISGMDNYWHDCISAGYGGAAYMTSCPTINLTATTITGNTAATAGGGIYIGGSATTSESLISGVISVGNTVSSGHGGGVYTAADNNLTIETVFCSGDACSGQGGGIYHAVRSAQMTTVRSAILYNCTAGTGGGMRGGMRGQNILIVGCTATTSGGGYQGGGALDKITVVGCHSNDKGGGITTSNTLTITNSIIYGNTADTSDDNIYTLGTGISITYTAVPGGYTGTGNIDLDADPFVNSADYAGWIGPDLTWNTADDGLRLAAGSALLTAGNTGGEIGAYAA